MSEDDGGLTEDDIVTWDDLPEAVADALEDGDVDVGGGEPDFDSEDAPWLEPEDAAEITERKMTEFMHHLTHEDCDTAECQQFRESFGIDPSGGTSSEGGADADADHDHDDPEDADTDADGGNEDSEGADETSTDDSDSTDESETSDDADDSGSDDAETNYLGEEI